MTVEVDRPWTWSDCAPDVAWASGGDIGRQKGEKNGGKGTYVRNSEVDVGGELVVSSLGFRVME